MTNPFDAAIEMLRFMGRESLARESEITSYKAAIRLLEAAGKLTNGDKGWLSCRVERAIAEYTPALDGTTCPGKAMKDRFRALLEALPEVKP